MLTLKNITKFSVNVHSADGDAIIITPSAIVTCDDKFLWQLDTSKVKIISRSDDKTQMRVVRPTSIPGPAPNPLSTYPKNSKDAIASDVEFSKVSK